MSKITFLLFLLVSSASFSQTEKRIHGKVSYQDRYQKNIDVINFTSKKLTQTYASGEFDIVAKVGDALILMSENFADQKYTLTTEDFVKSVVFITLIEKPIALEEVEITQIKAIKIAATSYDGIKMAKIEKDQSRPVNKDVYTGEIVNGLDFIQIGKMVGKLFKSNKPKTEKAIETMSFTDYAKANFNETFFTKTLKLKSGQTSRFLNFCEADPESKKVIKKNDELAILEFLLTKKGAFDKLK